MVLIVMFFLCKTTINVLGSIFCELMSAFGYVWRKGEAAFITVKAELVLLFHRQNPTEEPLLEKKRWKVSDNKTLLRPETSTKDKFLIKRTEKTGNSHLLQNSLVSETQNDSDTSDHIKFESVRDLREKARLHHEERVWFFESASHAYESGDGAGAKYYSNKGHFHTRLMEEANEDAFNLLIEESKPALEQTNTLDMHGFFVNEAFDYLEEVIEEREEASTRGREYLTVVTGKGRHSEFRHRLRNELIEFLNEGKYSYTENLTGTFTFKLRFRNVQNKFNNKPRNHHSHPFTSKVKKRYLEKKTTLASVANRFECLSDS